jgi:hypothetical protein
MLKFTFIVFVSLLLSTQAIADNFYGQVIYAQNLENKEYQEALNDLFTYLGKVSGRNFSLTKTGIVPAKGILLQLNQKGLLDPSLSKKLDAASSESFVLSGNSERLLIIAKHPSGLSKGIYSYLDWLGVKWYFPGEKWEAVPQKKSIIYPGIRFQSPSFLSRSFFGTGGIRRVAPIDADGKLMTEWSDWKRRNRMGSDFSIGGHYGEIFNSKHQKELEQHPEYLALVNGKRKWNVSAKWCVSNAGFRKLFIEDRVNELRVDLQSKTYPYSQVVLSVDPSDGGGDCECDNCRKLGTVSERYYFLANEVAKAFSKVSPKTSVSLLAYNTHAAPPSFPLQPNVVVMLVPYAFQNFGTPEQMIDAWTKRHNNLFVYDYYYIPDWHYEVPMPAKISSETLLKKIRYWKSKGIKGFQLESVYGTAVGGTGLYLAARLGWDASENPEAITNKFLNDMFGKAAAEAGQYFNYLKTGFEGSTSIAYLRLLLQKARQKGDVNVAKCISDLDAYVHYLTLFYQWQDAKNKSKAWEDLVQYVWEIYPLKIIHSSRIAELFYYKLQPGDPLINDWNIVEPYGKKLRQIRFANEEEIAELTKKDAKQNPVLEGFSYIKPAKISYILKNANIPEAPQERHLFGGMFPKTLVKASANGSVRFFIRQHVQVYKAPDPVTIKLIDTTTGAVVYSKTETSEKDFKLISIDKLEPNKIYRLSMESKLWFTMVIPKDQWMAFAELPVYSIMYTLWFYVPANTSFIYYSNMQPNQPVFKNEQGAPVTPEKLEGQGLFRLPISGKKGGWWTISSNEYKSLKFYSIPDLFFPHSGYATAGQ